MKEGRVFVGKKGFHRSGVGETQTTYDVGIVYVL